jgi:hypothetical protein
MRELVPAFTHQTDDLFLTDGGTETWPIYKKKIELPHFCSYHLLNDAQSSEALLQYYRVFALIAKAHQTGFVFCT